MSLKPITTDGKWDNLFVDDRNSLLAQETDKQKLEESAWGGNSLENHRSKRPLTPNEVRAAYAIGLATAKR
jgi:hypothetical protein